MLSVLSATAPPTATACVTLSLKGSAGLQGGFCGACRAGEVLLQSREECQPKLEGRWHTLCNKTRAHMLNRTIGTSLRTFILLSRVIMLGRGLEVPLVISQSADLIICLITYLDRSSVKGAGLNSSATALSS